MDRKQRAVLLVYVPLVLILAFAWVPWRHPNGESLGRDWIFRRPVYGDFVETDHAKIGVHVAVLTLAAGAMLLLFRDGGS